jgi:hypothetical protein
MTDEQRAAAKLLRDAGFHVYAERQILDARSSRIIDASTVAQMRTYAEAERFFIAERLNCAQELGRFLLKNAATWTEDEEGFGGKRLTARVRTIIPYVSDFDVFQAR